jgi:hypothetical protein
MPGAVDDPLLEDRLPAPVSVESAAVGIPRRDGVGFLDHGGCTDADACPLHEGVSVKVLKAAHGCPHCMGWSPRAIAALMVSIGEPLPPELSVERCPVHPEEALRHCEHCAESGPPRPRYRDWSPS